MQASSPSGCTVACQIRGAETAVRSQCATFLSDSEMVRLFCSLILTHKLMHNLHMRTSDLNLAF